MGEVASATIVIQLAIAMRIAVLIFTMLAFLGVSGCGQKGALYLRDNPPPGYKPPKPAPYTPVPYPADPEAESTAPKN
jgi:predicted small lipoprotein YifL